MHSFYCTAKEGTLIPSNKRELAQYLEKHEGKTFFVQIKRERGVRTDNQNRSLHLWLTMLAKELNASGNSVQIVLKEKIDIDWTPELCKELLWRTAQLAITGKRSTTQLDKVEDIGLVHDHLTRHLGEKFGLEYIPWPSEETLNETNTN